MRISDWSSDVCSSDLMYLDDVFSTNFGIARIAGIPDENAAIRGSERIYGWPMPYFSYYLAVAALKILILSVRDYSNGKTDRKSVVQGKSGSVRVDLGVRRIIKKKKINITYNII